MTTYDIIGMIELSIISILLLVADIIAIVALKNHFGSEKQSEKEYAKNKLYELYTKIDIIEIEQIIDNKLKLMITNWTLKHSLINNSDYLREDDVNQMIKEVTLDFTYRISDLYLFYIRCLSDVTTDEDLVRFVREKVKELSLDFITEYNSRS